MRAHAKGCEFVSWYNQNMRQGDFFKLIKMIFEKQVSEVQKNGKQTFEVSILVKKNCKIIFGKMRPAP